MVKLATTCMNVAFDKKANMKKYFQFMEEAAANGAALIVFPEQSLQGYLPSMTQLDFTHFQYQWENAERIEDGECIHQIIKKAKELNIYVVFGFTEKDPVFDDKLYNASILTGPDGLVGSYRKVHQPMDEHHFYYAGNHFPVYETAIGRIGLEICCDKSFPEAARELAIQGADIIVTPEAWPFAFPANYPDAQKDPEYIATMTYDRCRALENQIFYISANHCGFSGQSCYIGQSNIVAPNGQLLANSGLEEGVIYAEVDIKQDIYTGKTLGMGGMSLMRDRMPAVYTHIGKQRGEE